MRGCLSVCCEVRYCGGEERARLWLRTGAPCLSVAVLGSQSCEGGRCSVSRLRLLFRRWSDARRR